MQKIRLDKLGGILHKEARLLDIGCSAGQFLKAVAPHVGTAMGIEYNESDAAFVRSIGYKVWSVPIEETDIPLASLDIVTVYQTFEHVKEPQRFLKSIAKYLKPDGHLVIEVPNVHDPLLCGARWSAPATKAMLRPFNAIMCSIRSRGYIPVRHSGAPKSAWASRHCRWPRVWTRMSRRDSTPGFVRRIGRTRICLLTCIWANRSSLSAQRSQKQALSRRSYTP